MRGWWCGAVNLIDGSCLHRWHRSSSWCSWSSCWRKRSWVRQPCTLSRVPTTCSAKTLRLDLHTPTHLYYSSIIFSNNINGLLPVSIPWCSKFNRNSGSPLLSHYHWLGPPKCLIHISGLQRAPWWQSYRCLRVCLFSSQTSLLKSVASQLESTSLKSRF